jgi:hypothetical protein
MITTSFKVVSSDSCITIVIGLKVVSLVVASKPNIVTLNLAKFMLMLKIPSKSVSALVFESTAPQLSWNPTPFYLILSLLLDQTYAGSRISAKS